MSKKPERVMVIGLDGGTLALLQPLAEQGRLPHLAALMARGGWGRLESTVPPFTATAWSSFITGMNPGRHGVLSFQERDHFNYDTTGHGFVDARRFERTLWEEIGDNGRRVGVVNVPLTYPPRPVNGYLVSGMLTPPDAPVFTYPADLANRLGPDYIIDVDFIRHRGNFRRSGFPEKRAMLAEISQMAQQRRESCLKLLAAEPWAFFMVVFTSTDRLAHFFWDDLAALVDDPAPAGLAAELLAFFHELDEAIGRLGAAAGEAAHILVMSDHGFGPSPTRRVYLNVWLEQQGWLARRPAQGVLDLEYWRVLVGRNRRLKAWLRRLIPQATQDAVQATAVSRSDDIIAWGETQAYWVPIYFHVAGIELNVQGERREGIVPPGAAYERLRDELIAAALRLADPQTGTRIVETAVRREALYAGPYLSSFPDIILVLHPDYVGAGSLAGTSLVETNTPFRPGEHRPDGIFVAAGPAVSARGELEGLRLLDVPATILYLLGLPVPSTYDGRVLTELFDEAHLAANPVQWREAPAPVAAPTEALYSAADEAEIESRLRGLGYLD